MTARAPESRNKYFCSRQLQAKRKKKVEGHRLPSNRFNQAARFRSGARFQRLGGGLPGVIVTSIHRKEVRLGICIRPATGH
jgi:hypothetical protein